MRRKPSQTIHPNKGRVECLRIQGEGDYKNMENLEVEPLWVVDAHLSGTCPISKNKPRILEHKSFQGYFLLRFGN